VLTTTTIDDYARPAGLAARMESTAAAAAPTRVVRLQPAIGTVPTVKMETADPSMFALEEVAKLFEAGTSSAAAAAAASTTVPQPFALGYPGIASSRRPAPMYASMDCSAAVSAGLERQRSPPGAVQPPHETIAQAQQQIRLGCTYPTGSVLATPLQTVEELRALLLEKECQLVAMDVLLAAKDAALADKVAALAAKDVEIERAQAAAAADGSSSSSSSFSSSSTESAVPLPSEPAGRPVVQLHVPSATSTTLTSPSTTTALTTSAAAAPAREVSVPRVGSKKRKACNGGQKTRSYNPKNGGDDAMISSSVLPFAPWDLFAQPLPPSAPGAAPAEAQDAQALDGLGGKDPTHKSSWGVNARLAANDLELQYKQARAYVQRLQKFVRHDPKESRTRNDKVVHGIRGLVSKQGSVGARGKIRLDLILRIDFDGNVLSSADAQLLKHTESHPIPIEQRTTLNVDETRARRLWPLITSTGEINRRDRRRSLD
jgi:hypothetical protein